ncbi:MAG: tRNA 4-thiouridine(8) synthase ThiI [Candidatus Omnitrophota bacterium]|nr:tRNA 4-thiouridine(8) synthase ThiI [Candidatus Omnitrophota bacterium]
MKKKAIALISGGLDSLLAAKVVKEQGVEVLGVAFVMSAVSTDVKTAAGQIREAAEDARIPVRVIDVSEKFLSVLRTPEYGYGSNINPCIDCKIFMLREAKGIMEREGASFVITGEVLGERPMSQNRNSLDLIKKMSFLGERLLRPLSAKSMKETIPEKEGVVDREKLLDIKGRSRKPQLALAEKFAIHKFSAPGASCLLTDPEFAGRVKDLMNKNRLTADNVDLLKYGRHFRLDEETKAVVGRDERDNTGIMALKKEDDVMLRLKGLPGPYVLLRGRPGPGNIAKAAALVVSHSKFREKKKIPVEFWKARNDKKIIETGPITREEIGSLRV